MSESRQPSAPRAATVVNIRDDFERQAWARYFGVSEERLKDCVKKAGTRVKNVRRCLEEPEGG